jgi:hypothetical protein
VWFGASVVGVVVLVSAVSVSCVGGSSDTAASSPALTATGTEPFVVTCDQIILRPKVPFANGYRRVLDEIAVPPAYIPQVVSTPSRPWPYWEKAGLVVRAGRVQVSVSVPQAWRTRAAITWGNGKPAASSLRFHVCPSPPNVWNAYAGGFFLRSRGACVPLLFQVGTRRRTVRFGIDRKCSH